MEIKVYNRKFRESNFQKSDIEGVFTLGQAAIEDIKELEKLMLDHDLYLDEGYIFGEEGNGFERVSIACPTDKLLKALERFKEAVVSLK